MKVFKTSILFIVILSAFALVFAGCGWFDDDDDGTTTSPSAPVTPPVTSVNLPETGQTTSYATGDDGELQKGVAWPSPRFTDNNDGTVTDELTGLMWLKDGNCFGTEQWFDGAANYPALETVTDFNSNPGNYSCTDYTASYTDWRLPNRKELRSLINYEEPNTAAWLNNPAQGFSNVQAVNYWSSTTFASNTGYAWVVNMYLGFVNAFNKTNFNYVWPVRAGQ